MFKRKIVTLKIKENLKCYYFIKPLIKNEKLKN